MTKGAPVKQPKLPEVTCYLCRRTFQKEVHGAAHNRIYYRCEDCLSGEREPRTAAGSLD